MRFTLRSNQIVIRAVTISLGLATATKQRRVASLLKELRSAANFYAESLWKEPGRLDAITLRRHQSGSLGYRQNQEVLKMVLETVTSVRASGKRASCPKFRRAIRLSSLTCKVETGKGNFDFVLKISGLSAGNPIVIPFKSHKRLNHWLALGAMIKNGCFLSEQRAWIFVELPDKPLKEQGRAIGLDIGFNKLIADSDGNFHGSEIKSVCDKVRRKKPASCGKRRARMERRDYVNFVCRRLPWQTTKTFVLEDLTGMKVGKGNRGKRNRKLLAPWSYRQVRTRLEQLAQENRVRLEFVNPKGTSRCCPRCGWESAKNRRNEDFLCVRCYYSADADFVGAQNILKRAPGNCPESMVPVAVCGR